MYIKYNNTFNRQACANCKRRSDYGFVKEFIARENDLLIQIANQQQALHQCNIAHQHERVCLNTLQTHFNQIAVKQQAAQQELKATRGNYERQFQDLKLKYHTTQDALRLEKQAHDDLRNIMGRQ